MSVRKPRPATNNVHQGWHAWCTWCRSGDQSGLGFHSELSSCNGEVAFVQDICCCCWGVVMPPSLGRDSGSLVLERVYESRILPHLAPCNRQYLRQLAPSRGRGKFQNGLGFCGGRALVRPWLQQTRKTEELPSGHLNFFYSIKDRHKRAANKRKTDRATADSSSSR